MKDEIFHRQLVERYTSGNVSDDELIVFFQLLKEGRLEKYLNDQFMARAGFADLQEAEGPTIGAVTEVASRSKYRSIVRVAIAACIAGVVAAGIWWMVNAPASEKHKALAESKPTLSSDLPPGGNRATLTLSNGKALILDSTANGIVTTEGSTKVIKQADGHIVYTNQGSGSSSAAVLYNSLTTPNGGEYQLTLPDGSRVWLNAASRIRYPATFTGNKRTVEVDGEAYFEVAPHASMPFTVQMPNGVNIDILGTRFNVHSYNGEPVITTLLQGAVRVQSPQRSVLLKPGQEAILQTNGDLHVNSKADTDEAVAWKNGLFEFDRADITAIMRQLERWYNVEVVYTGPKSDRQFVGKASRSMTLLEVLRILELNNIHCRLEGRKLIVMPEQAG